MVSGKKVEAGIILANTKALEDLPSDADTLFLDGTFRTCPKHFYQVLNVATCYEGEVILLFSVVMTTKSMGLYKAVLRQLKNVHLAHLDKITEVHTDFEAALYLSAEEVFGARIRGCCFHFTKAVCAKLRAPSKFCSFSIPKCVTFS